MITDNQKYFSFGWIYFRQQLSPVSTTILGILSLIPLFEGEKPLILPLRDDSSAHWHIIDMADVISFLIKKGDISFHQYVMGKLCQHNNAVHMNWLESGVRIWVAASVKLPDTGGCHETCLVLAGLANTEGDRKYYSIDYFKIISFSFCIYWTIHSYYHSSSCALSEQLVHPLKAISQSSNLQHKGNVIVVFNLSGPII